MPKIRKRQQMATHTGSIYMSITFTYFLSSGHKYIQYFMKVHIKCAKIELESNIDCYDSLEKRMR